MSLFYLFLEAFSQESYFVVIEPVKTDQSKSPALARAVQELALQLVKILR